MKYSFDSRLGEQLYRLLPEVYRTRDRYEQQTSATHNEDLAHYLDAHGSLLDLIHATLEQQLKDTQPTTSQDWLLPYFAQLLAVNIMSPDSAGKHAEVDKAVSWRQRKGTLKVAEEIAESVGNMEAEIQEGWKRVAMTPRIGMPVIPVSAVDNTLAIDDRVPSQAAQHPSLPAVMVDLRRPSRAVEALATNPAANVSSFGGLRLNWRQLNYHGLPCFPGSFDDVSRRTVDMRTPSKKNGHYHHKRVLAYVSPPDGLIPLTPIEITWAQRNESLYEHLIEETIENGVIVIRNTTKRVIAITDNVSLPKDSYKLNDIDDSKTKEISSYKFEGINFRSELKVASGGKLELVNVEVDRVDVATPSTDEHVVFATNTLISVLSSGGLVQLDSCTVRDQAFLTTSIIAKDCILTDIIGTDVSGTLEYTRYPSTAPFSENDMTIEDCTTDDPKFFTQQTALDARSILAPDTPSSIHQGASDSGEMGYFHHGRVGRPVQLSGNFTDEEDALDLPNDGGYPLQDVIFEGNVKVNNGRFQLQRSVIASLEVITDVSIGAEDFKIPVIDAQECLFDKLTVTKGLARLEYCTVMELAQCKYLQTSDCIFKNLIVGAVDPQNNPNCVRYSRIPAALDPSLLNAITGRSSTNTTETPVFIRSDYCRWNLSLMSVTDIGEIIDEGHYLIIVALVNTKLHIRIFNSIGKKVIDKAENELVVGEKLTALKQRLTPLPDETSLSQQDKQEI
ncbi:MAG: hypothetical protein GY806_21815, partial [Gammaproteobacteria bacterium]|nr:hypothetical protein [Gammaproteobacteria bacterium]